MQCISCGAEALEEYFYCQKCQKRKSSVNRLIIIGILEFIAGGVLTFGTYLLASMTPNGGVFFIFYGLVIVGVTTFFKGIINKRRFREFDKNSDKYISEFEKYNNTDLDENALERYIKSKKEVSNT